MNKQKAPDESGSYIRTGLTDAINRAPTTIVIKVDSSASLRMTANTPPFTNNSYA